MRCTDAITSAGRRLALESIDTRTGPRAGTAAWAVALIPNVHAPTVQDVDVDVLLHFHGYGAGYRMLKENESDFAGVLKPGQLRDESDVSTRLLRLK